MKAQELRKNFLDFFKSKGHMIIPSASLIPRETDPAVLFTTAGMHPLVPYLLGGDHPGGKRVANIQKCVRTIDIDEVGDESHLTFFEMMGNWSFGDPASPDGIGAAGYFKEDAIKWSWEFLTDKKWLGISPERITITVFAGDKDAPRDEESAGIWKSLGVLENKIDYKSKDENWWGPAGATGPCGPDTEIFIDGIEAWNDVFMEYDKKIKNQNAKIKMTNQKSKIKNNEVNYKYVKLKQKNVDTGMGLERIAVIMQGEKSVYETDLFLPIVEKIKNVIPTKAEGSKKLDSSAGLGMTNEEVKSFRIIADHIKAAVFIIADGIASSNVGQGYVLRRLIRRAIRHGKLLDIEKNFTKNIAEVVIEIYEDSYPEVEKNKDKIFEELEKEENKFRQTLEKGIKEFDKILASSRLSVVSGKAAFDLYQTYGFPIELTKEIANERGYKVDEKGFNDEYKKHQNLSRTAAAGKFKGGLAEAGEAAARLHTAAHLLLAALREVLGPHVCQKGSNITAERLRLDFSHQAKMTEKELEKAENRVNEIIRENAPVECREMSVEEAKEKGAIGVFESKYGDKVKVYTIDCPPALSTPSTSSGQASSGRAFSAEICGGPHAKTTGELGHFRVIKEKASSAGVRRIKAILE